MNIPALDTNMVSHGIPAALRGLVDQDDYYSRCCNFDMASVMNIVKEEFVNRWTNVKVIATADAVFLTWPELKTLLKKKKKVRQSLN